MDSIWLDKCREEHMPCPPFDRYIYMLPEHVVKKRLVDGELGYDGHEPDVSTLESRDENEIRAMELPVRKYTTIPIPELIHRGDGFNVFSRIPGITVNEVCTWDKITPRQREGIKLQVQGFIKQLATNIPNQTNGSNSTNNTIRSLIPSGEIFHRQLPHRGPFESTAHFLQTYETEDVPHIHQISRDSNPVFSHMDWDLSNIVFNPNFDGVAGVIDWERAAFFPEGGRSIHRMCHQWDDWEKLFDGLDV